MISALRTNRGRLEPIDLKHDPDALGQAIWIDLIEPTDEERSLVSTIFSHPLPETSDVEEIEASSNYFVFEDGFQVNCLFLHRSGEKLKNSTVAMLLDEKRLVTLSAREIPIMRLLRMRLQRRTDIIDDPVALVMELHEIKVDELADILEETHRSIESISRQVLDRNNEAELVNALDGLARTEDINAKVRLCLMDGQRDLGFLLRHAHLSPEYAERVRLMLGDIETLLPHNTFLSEKVDFLLNAALGFINLQQNNIIKIFSIAAVVFLPPTLVASIYGMNFRFMPELTWHWGYPLALVLMVLSGIAPYLYFKRKGWL